MKPVLDCVAPTQPLLPFDSIALGRRAFLVIRPDEWPTEALCWSSPREKGLVRRAWAKSSGSRIRHACARPASRVGICRTVFEIRICVRE